ncbi:Type IV pilus biogenesis protein PilQ [hydrothermal vent metagenome]|uniref:Type IV pilus biogenesis protein PilQ n=1 Tax=hydrothermal vent metagenome TaxID=652676 RepID=A0A1W1CSX7_9ZZZZ
MKYLLIFVFLIQFLYAQTDNCQSRLFSLSSYNKGKRSLTVADILQEISLKCNVSIIFKDKESKEKIKKRLDYVNIKDYTFENFLDFLFNESNLFYSYDSTKNFITVQYKKTKTFNIDYINLSELTSQSTKSINAGTGGLSTGNTYNGGGINDSMNSMGGNNGINGNNSMNSSGSSNDQTTITTKSKFTFWTSLKESLAKLFPNKQETSIFINRGGSLLTITANKTDMQKAEKFLDLLMKRMHKQVLIEAKLIELIYDDSQSTGIDWSQLNISLNGQITGTGGDVGKSFNNAYKIAYNFSTANFFKYLSKYGDVKVMSNPKILTMNNQPAVVNIGEQLSYKYQTGSVATTGGTAASTNTFSLGSTFIGITLYVIPEITDDNEIIMSINPVVSSLTQNDADGTASTDTGIREIPPDTKIKQITSIVKVKNGQKVLIGGLISATKGKGSTKIPLLGDIPIMSSIFSYKTDVKKRVELFVLITPKIVKNASMPTIEDIDNDKLFSTTSLLK